MQSEQSSGLSATLEHLVAQGADAARISAAVVSVWAEIEAALIPIIGQQGIAALYERSLYLTRVGHPWLVAIPETIDARMDLAALQAVLAQQSSAAAAAAGGAHLKALHELLGSLIGTSLTERLLRSAWGNSFAGPTAQDPPP